MALVAANHAPAVVDQALQIQGTNLVLSWPSPGGSQQYLIQYRQTLDAATPWTDLTNNYPANSTNRTTYTIYGAVPPPPSGGGSGLLDTNPPPSPMSAATLQPTEPMAARADGTGSIVPLALYPPGFDLSPFLIYDPAVADWVSGATYVRPAPVTQLLSRPMPQDGPDPDGPPSSGFFRVFHIPDWSFNVTNYTYDGPTFFPVDFADYMDLVDDPKLLLDGQETEFAEFMPYDMGNGQTNWGIGIYLDRLPNGNHTIQLVSSLRLNELVGEDTVYLLLSNAVRTITVNNQITFTNWTETVQGSTYAFDAHIANPNSDWWIDIYDANGYYVNTGSGHTTDGHISWTWDLTDYLDNPRTDFDSDPYFYSETTFSTAGRGPATTRSNPTTPQDYPNKGEWLIAFQDRWFSDGFGYAPDCQEKYTDAMGYTWGGPNLIGDTVWWYPIKFGTNVYSQPQRDNSWTNLLSWIGSPWVRNFYYHGHGGPSEIGADMHTYDTNGLVTGSAMASRYSQSHLFAWRVAQKTRGNRYRFVFLDGCSTAAGNWPSAFCVSPTNHDITFYQNDPKHRRPSAFVGWAKDIGGKGYGSVYHWLDFEANWMGIWANDYQFPSIKESLEWANSWFEWMDEGKFQEDIRVYGYQDMLIDDYNRAGDWTRP